MSLKDLAENLEKGDSFYVRLFSRAYDIEMTQEIDDDTGRITSTRSRLHVKDEDLAQAYRLLILMRKTLGHCANQFKRYGESEHHQLDTATLTLVERDQLADKIDRNLGIAGIIERLLDGTPELPANDWKPISTAPQDGRPIRLLGKREDGSTYIETGAWANIAWSVEHGAKGTQAPTHWMELEALPEDYS